MGCTPHFFSIVCPIHRELDYSFSYVDPQHCEKCGSATFNIFFLRWVSPPSSLINQSSVDVDSGSYRSCTCHFLDLCVRYIMNYTIPPHIWVHHGARNWLPSHVNILFFRWVHHFPHSATS